MTEPAREIRQAIRAIQTDYRQPTRIRIGPGVTDKIEDAFPLRPDDWLYPHAPASDIAKLYGLPLVVDLELDPGQWEVDYW